MKPNEYLTRSVVGRLHVSATRLDAQRAIRQAMRRGVRTSTDPDRRQFRRDMYKIAAKVHEENQTLYADVMSGRLGHD